MTIARFKQLCLFSLIGFLSISAIIAVASLLSGDFGSTQIKIILTALTISGASICAMACSAFIEKRGLPWLGGVGVLLAVAAATMTIAGMWAKVGQEDYWKAAVSLMVLSAAFAHGLLLCLPRLPSRFRWIQASLIFFVAVLSLQIIFAICGEIQVTGYYRLMGIVAVLVVLLTLIVPICWKLASTTTPESPRLLLDHVEGDVYCDSRGVRYRVTKLPET